DAMEAPFMAPKPSKGFPAVDPFTGEKREDAWPLRPAGTGRLRVVKQHIKRYERAEIAHVENVMAGETRERTHRMLQRRETELLSEQETETEREAELEQAERFELASESSRTLKEDTRFKASLALSAKYGPYVEFSANAEFAYERREERSTRNATEYAQKITTRSLERVKARALERRNSRILRESEEQNLHRFEAGEAHRV